MSTYNSIVLLLIGCKRLITDVEVRHFLEQGVGQVRVYSCDEEGLTALRGRLQTADVATATRVKYYVGDVNDQAYLAEAMDSVDYVVCETWTLNLETCDADPAEACTALLHPINVVMDTAIQQKVRKLVVLGQSYDEPLSDMRSLIAALFEKVVVAQGRHQSEEDDTSICFVRLKDGKVVGMLDEAFSEA